MTRSIGIPTNGRSRPAVLALVSHDEKKDDLARLILRYRSTLARLHLVATAHAGELVSAETGLPVERMGSGPKAATSRSALASFKETWTPWCSCATR